MRGPTSTVAFRVPRIDTTTKPATSEPATGPKRTRAAAAPAARPNRPANPNPGDGGEGAPTFTGNRALMLDGNKRLSVEQSFEIAREIDRLGFAWFEEPFPPEDLDRYASGFLWAAAPPTVPSGPSTIGRPRARKRSIGCAGSRLTEI